MHLAVIMEQCLNDVPGGTGRYTREMARALQATRPSGAELTGWTAWHADVSLARVEGVAGPRRLPLGRRAMAAAWGRGVGPAPRGCDVVFAPTLLHPPRRRRYRRIVAIHDTIPWTHPQTLTPRGVRWHQEMGQRAAMGADLVVVPTHAVRRDVEDLLHPRGRVIVISEGVSKDLRVPDDVDKRLADLGIEDDFLLFIGTLEPRKGLDTLLDAMTSPTLSARALVVVGQSGWGGVDLLSEVRKRGLSGARVHATGGLPDADVAALLHRADLLVAPSRTEGFGLPVLEAMAFGVPVVASDAPALMEIASGAAEHFPAGDADALARTITAVLSDSQLAARLRRDGLHRSGDFNWENAGNRLWTALLE